VKSEEEGEYETLKVPHAALVSMFFLEAATSVLVDTGLTLGKRIARLKNKLLGVKMWVFINCLLTTNRIYR
jgi:hypothetical protein